MRATPLRSDFQAIVVSFADLNGCVSALPGTLHAPPGLVFEPLDQAV